MAPCSRLGAPVPARQPSSRPVQSLFCTESVASAIGRNYVQATLESDLQMHYSQLLISVSLSQLLLQPQPSLQKQHSSLYPCIPPQVVSHYYSFSYHRLHRSTYMDREHQMSIQQAQQRWLQQPLQMKIPAVISVGQQQHWPHQSEVLYPNFLVERHLRLHSDKFWLIH